MTFGELRYCLAADHYREDCQTGYVSGLRAFCRSPEFRYLVLWRLRVYFKSKPFLFALSYLTGLLLTRATYRLGIRIPLKTKVGPGLYIPHFGGIWINPEAVIGANCNLSQGVTIGGLSTGESAGAPNIGDNVYIGPNATIVGGVRIGNNALISANSLIITDVPDNGVMIGVPAKLFSQSGSAQYVNNTGYDTPK